MSTYNADLQQNNTELDQILQTVNNLPETAPPYILPIASETQLGGVTGPAPTAEQTETAGIDENGNIKYKAGGGVPSENKWELIESFTVDTPAFMDKTATPDGKMYNFQKLQVRYVVPPNTSPHIATFINGAKLAFDHWFGDTSVAAGGILKIENGALNTVTIKPTSAGAEQGEIWQNTSLVTTNENIKKIHTSQTKFPTGSKVTLWGVWA